MDARARSSVSAADPVLPALNDWRVLLVGTSSVLPLVLVGAMVAVGRFIAPVLVIAVVYVAGVALLRRGDMRGAFAVAVPSVVLMARHAASLTDWIDSWSDAASTAESLATAVVMPLAAANLVAAVAMLRGWASGMRTALVSGAVVGVLAVVAASAAVAAAA